MLTRISNDIQIFSLYEKILASRHGVKETKIHEIKSLRLFVEELLKNNIETENLDGFFFSYEIKHIGKEFDLLKISKDLSSIINIELKSEAISEEKIRKQLIQNKYYLNCISTVIYSYTYISSLNMLYHLDDRNELVKCDFAELISKMQMHNDYIQYDIDSLFKASNYLISPLNTPEKFIIGQYFLTNHQNYIKGQIIERIEKKSDELIISISGEAGTGKTLLLYDLAKECSRKGKVCIIHCGVLCDGHFYLQNKLSNLDIITIEAVSMETDFSIYDFIFIDETQRIYEQQLNIIINAVRKRRIYCVFSYDLMQILSNRENNRDMANRISSLSNYNYTLTDTIRTNQELATFINKLFDLNIRVSFYSYSNVDIVFASKQIEAIRLIEYYKNKDYTFISFTPSQSGASSLDIYGHYSHTNTHKVIGQEFDNVLMLLDNTFYYDQNNQLCAKSYPSSDYVYKQLLFQGLTRARERLCIIVIEDIDLFSKILTIKRDYH